MSTASGCWVRIRSRRFARWRSCAAAGSSWGSAPTSRSTRAAAPGPPPLPPRADALDSRGARSGAAAPWSSWGRSCGGAITAPRLLEIAVSLVEEATSSTAAKLARVPTTARSRVLAWGESQRRRTRSRSPTCSRMLPSRDGLRWRLVVCGEGPLRRRSQARLARARRRGPRRAARLRRRRRDARGLSVGSLPAPPLLDRGPPSGADRGVRRRTSGRRNRRGRGSARRWGRPRCLVPAGDVGRRRGRAPRPAGLTGATRGLIERGLAYAKAHTIEREAERLRAFIAGPEVDAGRLADGGRPMPPHRPGPLIIVGTGRCGSTLLHRLLAHHERLGWLSTSQRVVFRRRPGSQRSRASTGCRCRSA